MTDTLEPCCHGFIHTSEQLPGAAWSTQVAFPFKPRWLWLWGDEGGAHAAVLRSLCVALDEHLVQPMPFAFMTRTMPRENFIALVTMGPNVERIEPGDGRTSLLFKGARVHPLLARNNGHPEVQIRQAKVGEQLSVQATGNIHGIVLVGHQLVPPPKAEVQA